MPVNRAVENAESDRLVVGAVLLEQSDEWAVQRGRYMTLETMAGLSWMKRPARGGSTPGERYPSVSSGD